MEAEEKKRKEYEKKKEEQKKRAEQEKKKEEQKRAEEKEKKAEEEAVGTSIDNGEKKKKKKKKKDSHDSSANRRNDDGGSPGTSRRRDELPTLEHVCVVMSQLTSFVRATLKVAADGAQGDVHNFCTRVMAAHACVDEWEDVATKCKSSNANMRLWYLYHEPH